MKQEEFEKYLENYLDGSLEGAALKEFERALAGDPALRHEADAQRKLTGMLRQVESPKAPASLRSNIMKELRTEAQKAEAQQAAARKAAQKEAFFKPAPQKMSMWDRLAASLPQWRFQMAVALAFIAGIVVTYAVVRPAMMQNKMPGGMQEAAQKPTEAVEPTVLAQGTAASPQEKQIAMASPQDEVKSEDQPRGVASAEETKPEFTLPSTSLYSPDKDLMEDTAGKGTGATSTPAAPSQPGRVADLGAIPSTPRIEVKTKDPIVVADAPQTEKPEAKPLVSPEKTQKSEPAIDTTPIEEPQWPGEAETYQPGQLADATPLAKEPSWGTREEQSERDLDAQQMRRSFQPDEQPRSAQEAPRSTNREPSRLMGDIAEIAGGILGPRISPNPRDGTQIPQSRQGFAPGSEEPRADNREPNKRFPRSIGDEWRVKSDESQPDRDRARRQDRDLEAMPEPQVMADARAETQESSPGVEENRTAREGYARRGEIREPSRNGLDFPVRQGFQPAPFKYKKPEERRREDRLPAAETAPSSPAEMANMSPRPAHIFPAQGTTSKSSPVIITIITNGLTVSEIQSHLEGKGIDAKRARTQDGGRITSSLACSAPGRDLAWVMRQLRELGIEQDSSLNNQSIGSAQSKAARQFEKNPERKGIAFASAGRRAATGSNSPEDMRKQQSFSFHLNIVNVRDR